MKQATQFTRELASAVANQIARTTQPIDSAVNAVFKACGMVLAVVLGVWWLLALLADCGGMTC